MGNPFFFTFSNTDRTAPKNFRTVIKWHFIRKLLSKLMLDLKKCPNQKMHESESACFLVWELPAVQNYFLKQFSYKVLINYCSKFFGAFRSAFKKSKKRISQCKNVISKWPKVFWEFDRGCFEVFDPYFIGKSPCTTF